MRRKGFWLLVTSLTVASLALASCAPAPAPTPAPTPSPALTPSPAPASTPTPTAKPAPEAPRYGGTFIAALTVPPTGFDDAYTQPMSFCWTLNLTNEEPLSGDWTKGPTGTGEASWLLRGTLYLDAEVGCLAESWERPDLETVILHIRKGVRFHDKPPASGREVNANDVVFSLKRLFGSPLAVSHYANRQYVRSITAPDKWTVVVKSTPGDIAALFVLATDFGHIVPPEAVEKFGDLRDWRNSIGTGPFMLVDVVSGSSIAMKRNPSYWDKDPFYPQNQLPYLDGIKWLVIEDKSTQMAAMRTGKTDWLVDVGWEDAASLRKTNPELKERRFLQAAHQNVIFMRLDRPVLPFKDIRVRRALAMAVDKEAIKRDYYGGNAELLSTPVAPYPELMRLYTPLEKQSEIVREYYGYHPEKAKKLLAEAGYPNGFKSEIVCWQQQVDLISIVKDYWAKIGVTLSLDVKEYSVYRSIATARTHREIIYGSMQTVAPTAFAGFRSDNPANLSMIDDPRCNAAWEVVRVNNVVNQPKADQALKEIFSYILDQVWHIETPSPYVSTIWQPWVKGYAGEVVVGYANPNNFLKWVWYDQELKRVMLGKK